jgi:predicted NUDIX family NTP pyrophosphohydrolase
MRKTSAGILMYRNDANGRVVLLAHPGGPFYRNKDAGAWTIPKGELDTDEEPAHAARREFIEEIGAEPGGALVSLGEIVQKGGKRVIAFAVEGAVDVTQLRSNTFDLEWPPRSGRMQSFPEVDRVAWMTLAVAREKILPSQIELLDRLERLLDGADQWRKNAS